MRDFYKKERPLQGWMGFGGGVTSMVNTGSANIGAGIDATGGMIGEYVDTDSGEAYKTHVFTSSGRFTVNSVAGDGEIEYLVIGGGGGGGSITGAGGGAGGLRTNVPGNLFTAPAPITVSGPSNIPITVGYGGGQGADGNYSLTKGQNGGDSVFGHPTSPVTASGGGGGGGYSPTYNGSNPGGSGGGGGGGGSSEPQGSTIASPDGITPTSQGHDGAPWPNPGTGGGGGAGGAAPTTNAGPPDRGGGGGIGTMSVIEGPTVIEMWTAASGDETPGSLSPFIYAGGGGGGAYNYAGDPNRGQPITAGDGGYGPTPTAYTFRRGGDAFAGYGGGGGGSGQNGLGGAGGSGIVVVRYKTGSMTATAKATGGLVNFYPGSPLSPTGATIHIFRGPGVFTIPATFNETCEYWMIGGGGGGGCGSYAGGGGGGSGCARYGTYALDGAPRHPTYLSLPIQVGRGGTAYTDDTPSSSGGPSLGTPSQIGFPGEYDDAWRASGGGGGGGPGTGGPGRNGEDGNATYVGSGGGGKANSNAPGGTGMPSPSPTGSSYPGGSGDAMPGPGNGGGGGGIGSAGGDMTGGAGLRLPDTFCNPTMIGLEGPGPGGEGGGGGLGYPGPGSGAAGWFWFGGGGAGEQYPTGYGQWGGGSTGVWPRPAVPQGSMHGWAGGGNGNGPDQAQSPPGPVSDHSPVYGMGGEAGCNSGGGGGGALRNASSPDNPEGGYFMGGRGAPGIVLIAYPQ